MADVCKHSVVQVVLVHFIVGRSEFCSGGVQGDFGVATDHLKHRVIGIYLAESVGLVESHVYTKFEEHFLVVEFAEEGIGVLLYEVEDIGGQLAGLGDDGLDLDIIDAEFQDLLSGDPDDCFYQRSL